MPLKQRASNSHPAKATVLLWVPFGCAAAPCPKVTLFLTMSDNLGGELLQGVPALVQHYFSWVWKWDCMAGIAKEAEKSAPKAVSKGLEKVPQLDMGMWE